MTRSLRTLRVPLKGGRLAYLPSEEHAQNARQLFDTRLFARHFDKHGHLIADNRAGFDFQLGLGYDLGSGLVTTAGVNYLAADMAGGASDISAFTWHGTGTGVVAAAIADTALGTPAGPARVSGVQTTPGSVNIFQTVATLAYTTTLAITEWGLFSAVTTGTMWDRKVFAAINVVNGDSIQFTYQLTVTAGG